LRERQRENDALRAQVDKSKRDNTALIEQVALLKAENVGDNAIPPALLTQRRDAVLEHAARTTLGYVHQADVAFDGLPVLPEERATSP
jgi:cell division protein FtsB